MDFNYSYWPQTNACFLYCTGINILCSTLYQLQAWLLKLLTHSLWRFIWKCEIAVTSSCWSERSRMACIVTYRRGEKSYLHVVDSLTWFPFQTRGSFRTCVTFVTYRQIKITCRVKPFLQLCHPWSWQFTFFLFLIT